MVPFASYVSLGYNKPRLIFSRINGPNMRHAHNSLYMVILTYKADITGYVTKRNEKKRNGKKYHRI